MNVGKDISINVNEINKLILDIVDSSNEIKSIFNKIDDLIYETKSYYDCASGNLLRNKYSQFRYNYDILISNILSHKEELINLKKKYALNISNLSQNIISDASKLDSTMKYKERR